MQSCPTRDRSATSRFLAARMRAEMVRLNLQEGFYCPEVYWLLSEPDASQDAKSLFLVVFASHLALRFQFDAPCIRWILIHRIQSLLSFLQNPSASYVDFGLLPRGYNRGRESCRVWHWLSNRKLPRS